MSHQSFDLVVVGTGVFGLSTAVFLCTQYPSIKFALLEQFKIGHREGSSHSEIRIIRSTYRKEFYRDLCVEGINAYWPAVEKLFKETFIAANSCLYFDENEETSRLVQEVARSSKGQIEVLSIEQVRKRFPSAPYVDTKLPVFHDTKAGVVFAEKYIKAMEKFLRDQQNITIFQDTSVISVENNVNGVKLNINSQGKSGTILTKKAALSCGRWIGKLVPEMKNIVAQARQTVSFWKMKQPENYQIGRFPTWIHSNKDHAQYYGLPDYNGVGMKYGLHSQDSSLFNKFPNESEYEKYMIQNYHETSERYFKGRYEKLNKIEKCYYTVTKSEDFVIDWSDQHENVLIVSPCSGHGFKFGPVIGKIVADLLVKDQSIAVFEQGRYLCRLFYHLGVNLK